MVPDFSDEVIATRWQRFFNYLVDLLVQYAILIMIGGLAGALSALFDWTGLVDFFIGMSTLQGYLLGFAIAVSYYFIAETVLKGRTIGKFVTGTMVVDENGEAPNASVILKRSFCRLIPFEAFSFFGDRGWHDSISSTYVVKKNEWETMREVQLSFEEIGSQPAGL